MAYVRHILWRENIDLALIMETGPDVDEVGKAITWDVEGGGSFFSRDWGTWAQRFTDAGWRASWADTSYWSSAGKFYKFHKTGATGKPTTDEYAAETYLVIYSTSGGKRLDQEPTIIESHDSAHHGVYRGCCALSYCGVNFCFLHAPSPGHQRDIRKNVLGELLRAVEGNMSLADSVFLGDLNFREPEQDHLGEVLRGYRFAHAGPGRATSLRISKNLMEPKYLSEPFDQVWNHERSPFTVGPVSVLDPRDGEFTQQASEETIRDMLASLEALTEDWQPRDGRVLFSDRFSDEALADLEAYFLAADNLFSEMAADHTDWGEHGGSREECLDAVDRALRASNEQLQVLVQAHPLAATRYEYVDNRIRQIGDQIDRIASFALRGRNLFRLYRTRISDHLPVLFEVRPLPD